MEPDGLQEEELNEEEPFQQAVKKGYRKMKIRLIGKGGNKYVSAGMEKPSYARAKSAPPGFGGSLEEKKKKKKKKDDRCIRIAKRKYDVWPSAYASGAVVKCRKGKIWKGLKEGEQEHIDAYIISFDLQEKKKKAGTESSKESSLRDWFGRKGGKGKSKGWVDCNTCRKDKKTGRKTCKSCGRQEGEKRSKYPACRPTPAACDEKGRGKSWGKKSAKEKK